MNRLLFIGLCSFIIFACEQPKETSETANQVIELPEQPNILWLVAEDLGPYIPPFGDNTIETPHLSRLAAEGICYDNVYSPSPVCAPSRAALSTGMYPTHIGANHMRTGPWYTSNISKEVKERYKKFMPDGMVAYEAVPPTGVKMMSEYLRAAGYYCTNNAKEDYQYQKTATAWDECGGTAHWKNRKEGQPFFAIFNYNVTHESQIWARAKDSLWIDSTLTVPVPPYLPDNEIGRRDVRQMYSNIRQMDYQVGQMLAALEASGELENTIIVWYTDHGGPLPRQKRLLYDSGLKVPMIIRYPNKQRAGQRDDRMISFIDFAPTALSMAGIEPLNHFDGKAFAGKYQRAEEPNYIFAAADRFDESYDRNRAVKDKQFKYIRYHQPEKSMFLPIGYREQMPVMRELHRLREAGELNEVQAQWFRATKPKEELFDTKVDPHEINNLADDPTYAEKLKELQDALTQWGKAVEDLGMLDEKELLRRILVDGQQPKVAQPMIDIKDGKATITCETEGVSIGYKLSDNPDAEAWTLYTEPFDLPEGVSFTKVIGDRIGYQASVVDF